MQITAAPHGPRTVWGGKRHETTDSVLILTTPEDSVRVPLNVVQCGLAAVVPVLTINDGDCARLNVLYHTVSCHFRNEVSLY